MTNEQLAKKYATTLNKCLTAIKILVICAIAAVGVLVVFAVIAAGANMQTNNPEGVLLGVVILGAFAAACVTGALAALLTAKTVMVKFKKLDKNKP